MNIILYSDQVGRLMLRKGIQVVTGLSNAEIMFSRSAEGRPFVEGLEKIDVNVSHHGDWVSAYEMSVKFFRVKMPIFGILGNCFDFLL